MRDEVERVAAYTSCCSWATAARDEFFTDELVAADNFAIRGDSTLLKFLLESKRREKFDGASARQE